MTERETAGTLLTGKAAESIKGRLECVQDMRESLDTFDVSDKDQWLMLVTNEGGKCIIEYRSLPHAGHAMAHVLSQLTDMAAEISPQMEEMFQQAVEAAWECGGEHDTDD